MKITKWILGIGTLGLGLFLTLSDAPRSRADAQDGDDQEAGVEAQGRGPVHEAFAEPGTPARPAPIIEKKPPDPIDEAPPDQKPDGDNVQWIPGYWAYDEDAGDYMWVSGCWRAIPPGKQWMPGHWNEVENGYQRTSGYWADADAQEAEMAPPPPQSIDAGPSAPAPAADSVYAPGVWVYQSHRYRWRPGFWYTPRPGWVWVPARYVWSPAGYVFIDGYWDYPLETRGLLFAPVVIDARLWGRPRWVYRPRVVLYTAGLLGSLFVWPNYGAYYFGDYFGPRYRERGFVPWINYRWTKYSPDPLFAYYRWRHRDDRAWARDLRGLYVDRAAGRAPLPPRTLVQQNTLIKNVTVNKTTNISNVTLMAPLNKVDKTVVKVRPITRAQVAEQTKIAQHYKTLSVERKNITAQAVKQGPAPTKPTDVPKVSKVPHPKTAPIVKPKVVVKPPPPPVKPAHVERPLPKHDPVKPVVVPKAAPKPTPKPKTEKPKTEVKPAPKPAPKPEVKPAPKPVAKPAPKPDPKPAPKKDKDRNEKK
jgi:hypothetical protein